MRHARPQKAVTAAAIARAVRSDGRHGDMPTRLRDALARAIRAGDIPEGSKLPSPDDLANGLAVSTGTIRTGLRRLVEEGIIESRTGPGGGYGVPNRSGALRDLAEAFVLEAREIAADSEIIAVLREKLPSLDQHAAKRGRRELSALLGRYRSGLSDVSRRHDDYLDR
ncbi:MAG: GntR family transcriptional regulator [Vulcanimicrobiaceae bacterium]|jgi:DNA-binding FadR family transcriptional regulator